MPKFELSRYRGFTFTIYEFDEYGLGLALEIYHTRRASYMILGFETCPTTDRDHIQGYIYFKNGIYEQSVRDLFSPCHIEIARGNPEQNKLYCSKDKLQVEFGELPCKGRASWDKIQNAMHDPINNPQTFMQYRKCYHEIIAKTPVDIHRPRYIYRINANEKMQLLRDILEAGLTICLDYADYLDEQVVCFTDCESNVFTTIPDMFIYWQNSIPQTYRMGYERRRFDPQVIIISYLDDEHPKSKHIKIFPRYIDSEHYANVEKILQTKRGQKNRS